MLGSLRYGPGRAGLRRLHCARRGRCDQHGVLPLRNTWWCGPRPQRLASEPLAALDLEAFDPDQQLSSAEAERWNRRIDRVGMWPTLSEPVADEAAQRLAAADPLYKRTRLGLAEPIPHEWLGLLDRRHRCR
jgi:hypothetical protein